MPLDAATTAFLNQMAEAGGKPIHESTPEEVRALGVMLSEMYGPGPEMARVEEHQVQTGDGQFTMRVFVPQSKPRGVIVYYHGGGWVIGALDEFDTLARRMAERSNCAVALPDYRLAPEHRYPTAADDAYAALEWTAAHLQSIAGDEVPLMVAGDSAGGNLAAVVALRARDRQGPKLAMQALIYPVTDADFENNSYTRPENQLMLTRESMIWFWDHYLPDATRRNEADAAPLQAGDLSGLPPALVLTAAYDVLCNEGEAYAERLKQAGVPVEHKRYEDQMHGFFTLLMLPASNAGLEQLATAIENQLAAQPA